MPGRLRRMDSRWPSDYFLFPQLKEHLFGTRFSSDSDVKTAVENWLNGLGRDFYQAGLNKQPGKSYSQAAADKKRKEEKTDEKNMETKTDKVMDKTDLKDSLQALREVKILLQEFPTLLEATRRCRQAKTEQEKRS
ncbi:hypothetical protein AVEN_99657-1 [Araneus ventricosus]|uniref:Uncharacterized protein n=1 Tax=Araneus ventricosus TaxID=182803 RepID=A0A4Y2DNL5_ARAVE|nr:hypothetical protein AVEN_99657-1 [Araneus ventricosus]